MKKNMMLSESVEDTAAGPSNLAVSTTFLVVKYNVEQLNNLSYYRLQIYHVQKPSLKSHIRITPSTHLVTTKCQAV